jgi:hypothetical protein
MSIESIAHSLQKLHPHIKRGQWYELLAAAFEFKSYAACKSQNIVFVPVDELTDVSEWWLMDRAEQLGLDYSQVGTAIFSVLEKTPILPIDMKDLSYMLEKSPDEYDPEVLLPLNTASEKGNCYAAYCLALILEPQIESPSPDPFWFMKKSQGETLSKIEHEFADSYHKYFIECSIYISEAMKAGRGGIKKALVKLINYSDGAGLLHSDRIQGFDDLLTNHGLSDLSQICRENSLQGNELLSLIEEAESGDEAGLRELASYFALINPQFTQALIEYAKPLGIDLTQDYTVAVDEHGNDYDDDIGGAIYVDGIEGINAPILSRTDKAAAFAVSDKWTQQLNESGSASFGLY